TTSTTLVRDRRSRIVGHSQPRIDARQKVTGQAVYGTDLQVPGMLYGKILRSQVSHARLKNVDASAALALPGVRTVLVGRDLHDIDPYYGPALKDQPILAIDTIRYQGEPVAAVVADDLETAEWALELVEIEYEGLPAAHTLDDALAEGAPLVHDTFRTAGHFRDLKDINPIKGTNICHHYQYRQGDVETGFAQADQVFEDVYELPPVHHYAMEPYVVLAEAGDEGITVWSATQHPFLVRKELAEIFGKPQSRVRVVVPLIGGAYGSKCYTKLEPLAVSLALRVARPVKLVTTVQEAFYTLSRHGARTRVKTGVRGDGTIVAREVEIYLDTGAYADVGPRVAKKAGFRVIGPYRVPNLKIDTYAVYTSKVPAGAYRGYGTPQGTWAVECQMDEIADWLNMDSLAFRLRNLRGRGEEYVPGDTPLDGEMSVALQMAAQGVGWSDSKEELGRGRGLACGIKDGGGTHTVSMASVRIHSDGSITVDTGSVEIGQGAHTVLAQITAEELGVPFEQVVIQGPNTSTTPYDQGTSASRATVLMGTAVQRAARHAREQLMAIAGKLLGCPVEGISITEGKVIGPDRSVSFGDVIAHHFGLPAGEIIGIGTHRPSAFEGSLGGAVTFWEIGAGAAEVAVDLETGQAKLLQYVSVADAGKAINPMQAEGQDEGAAMQGVGHALFEALIYEGGQLLNGNLVDYRVPSFEDLPENFRSLLVENQDGPGPFGAKGLGEAGVPPVAPAIGNAIYKATGVRIKHLPLTPEFIWRALQRHHGLKIAD
ncbi:xanthine dehydrogenase family protein molybdopterin-binding subunit, partial [Acidobacteria bacterium AH-259-D05]|nr:xanthine dehydrogenase family protein molybdopterin-binding subunit [Acidobacteria bacterium AH-259-D05]